ncbi:MAG TPA: TonB family protein [Vicinamibacteria bacterium]|nr:TonB family protein [Vicinamibacteria bacterium]
MAKREKFGKFVLLEDLEESGLGHEYRAAKLGSTGIEKVVSVLRLTPALSKHAESVKTLMDQVKLAAQLQNPNVLKIYGIGKVESAYYISYEYLEGKSVKAIFNRCRQEAFPLSVDHALLVASKICSALEYAHARKADAGARYFHGLVTPGNVLVSYEGEIRVRGFGYWPSRIREAGGVSEEESLYLAPEQASGGTGDPRCDTFAVGAILFEALVGQPLFQGGRQGDIAARIGKARLQNPTGDEDSIPKPIAEILHRALAVEPGARYGEIQEMRKAIDTLLFSGDFTPTTFNLAFFMHSLFRDDIERETKALKEEREASYLEYLTETTGPAAPAPAPPAPPPTVAHPSPPKAQPMDLRQVLVPPPPPPPSPAPDLHAEPEAAHAQPVHAQPTVTTGTFTFHKEKPKSKMPVIAGGLVAVVAIAAAGGYFLTRGKSAPPPPVPVATTLSAEEAAAMARVRELEEKLKALEEEKAAAETKAADDAKKKLEAQAAAKGQTVDPAALQKAQEEARKKAQLEQEKKLQEEKKRLEEEKKAEEARLADEQKRAEEEAARVAAAMATTTTVPAPPPTTAAPAIRPGTLVNLSDSGVTPPAALNNPVLRYPPIAERQKIDGTVTLNVLVDEKGNVLDAQVTAGAGGKAGLNEAAVENVKQRKYRPATKEGVPVKVWITVAVQFKLR